MCRIAGCIGRKDVKTVNRMLDALSCSGPGDRGLHINSNGVFGYTRLSIVDVAGGHQVIITNKGNQGIVCNGEIYNSKKIKETLIKKHDFQTGSDTETILQLYRDRGPDFVKELDGMFAFVIFDDDNFMMARDYIGIKPLYYGHKNGGLYFSSELGAMSRAGLNEVHEFPAGHYYTPKEGFVEYYRIPDIRDNLLTDIEETSAAIRETFTRAVKKRLSSDHGIHVGSLCSGGLDSSLITAIAAEEMPDLRTFVVGMKLDSGEPSDDIKASRIAADYIGLKHHELIFTEDDYYEALPRVIEKLETYDPSLVRCAVPCYFTCKFAADYVTVVLSGEGADELFSGYHYMKHLSFDRLNMEARRCIGGLHNINLQRTDRMGMLFRLELRVPFLDKEMIALSMKIDPKLKIRKHNNAWIEKWILRKAFEGTRYLPDEILWRHKAQYTKGAGCEDLGKKLAHKQVSEEEYLKIKAENPRAVINSREAAFYYKIFREFHPQDSILGSIGIWTGFDFEEEREKARA